jgi:phosphatidylinositol-3-phosphatase
VTTGDTWLSNQLPRIFSSAEYQSGDTAVFLTWDEDDNSASNHVPTIVMSPSTQPGTTSATAYNHYSLLRSTETMLGLPLLAGATTASDMRSAFGLG